MLNILLFSLFCLALFGALVWFLCHYNLWRRVKPDSMPRVLMYHSISDDEPSGLNTSPKKFEEQINYMMKRGYTFYKMSDLVKRPTDHKISAITFDDGYENLYHNAFPILKKYNIPATIYLIFSNNTRDALFPRLNHDQVVEMIESGLIEIGSHTVSHAYLPKLTLRTAENEITISKAKIEVEFGIKCNAFAYPYGGFNDRIRQMVRKCGYTSATTVQKSAWDIRKHGTLGIPRISMNGKMNHLQFYIALSRGRYKV